MNRLNPGFAQALAGPENSYDLRVPKDKMKVFMNEKDEILKESVQMTLDDKAAASTRAKFPPPARIPVRDSSSAKKATGTAKSYKAKTSGKKHSTARKSTAKKRTTTSTVAKKKK